MEALADAPGDSIRDVAEEIVGEGRPLEKKEESKGEVPRRDSGNLLRFGTIRKRR